MESVEQCNEDFLVTFGTYFTGYSQFLSALANIQHDQIGNEESIPVMGCLSLLGCLFPGIDSEVMVRT
jgi:hypothetical protein